MTRKELISAELAAWEEDIARYTAGLEEAIKYGDYGSQQHNEHMVQFSKDKVATLSIELQELKSA